MSNVNPPEIDFSDVEGLTKELFFDLMNLADPLNHHFPCAICGNPVYVRVWQQSDEYLGYDAVPFKSCECPYCHQETAVPNHWGDDDGSSEPVATTNLIDITDMSDADLDTLLGMNDRGDADDYSNLLGCTGTACRDCGLPCDDRFVESDEPLLDTLLDSLTTGSDVDQRTVKAARIASEAPGQVADDLADWWTDQMMDCCLAAMDTGECSFWGMRQGQINVVRVALDA